MRTLILTAAAIALVSGTTAQAAQDAGLSVQNYRSAAPQSGVGAQLGVTLKLDSRRVVRDTELFRLGVAVGRVSSQLQSNRRGPELVALSVRRGVSTTLSLAGQSIAKRHSASALRRASLNGRDLKSDGPRNNLKTGTAIAIGVVAIGALAGTLLLIAADISDCSDGNCE